MLRKKFLDKLKTPLTIFVVAIFLTITVITQTASASFANNISIDSLSSLTNQIRIQNGLSPLLINKKLEQAALEKANHMFLNDYWAYTAPDGTEPWSFIKNNNYSYESAGENLAKGFGYSNEVVDGWMNSPTHKANVLKSSYTDVGYAVMNGVLLGEETTLVVAMYGEQKITNIESSSKADYASDEDVATVLNLNKVNSSYIIILIGIFSVILLIRFVLYENKKRLFE